MSTAPVASPRPRGAALRASVAAAPTAAWASIAIGVMWLVVFGVALWGGDIVSHNASGGGSTVPSGVAVAALAFVATVVIARRGFRPDADVDELRAELAQERAERAALAARVDALERPAA